MAREAPADCPSGLLRALVEEHNKTARLVQKILEQGGLPTSPAEMPEIIEIRRI